jgi:hypothetical protein
MRDRGPFDEVVGDEAKSAHQSWIESLLLQLFGWRPLVAVQVATSSQILFLKRHSLKRWIVDSGELRQSGQTPSFGHPCAANLSEVQSRFCKINQPKNLYFCGAHILHNSRLKLFVVDPRNCAW